MHFTYQEAPLDSDLQQGDVLRRTPELQEVIERAHPGYIRDDYRHFAVLTQSCDLVRDRAADHVTIAAVRSLADAIRYELAKYQTNYVLQSGDVAPESAKARLKQFVERLFNNNEPEYFYLHEDAAISINAVSCIYLRLSIPLPIEHYDLLKTARVVSLNQTFQAKLGWLIGNIYSRVGTDDWVPKAKSPSEWPAFIDDVLSRNVSFVNDKKVDSIRKSHNETDLRGKTTEEVRALIKNAPERKRKDDAIEIIIKQLGDDKMLPDDQLLKLRQRLVNNSALSSLFR